jgi:xylulokinase
LWRQIQADIYEHEVETVEAEEGAAYGAALLAGVGTGVWPSVDAACDDVVAVRDRIEPDPVTIHAMRAMYKSYRVLYPALKNIFAPQA